MPEGNPNINVTVREQHRVRRVLGAAAIGIAGYVGLHGIGFDLPWPNWGKSDSHAEPEHAEASVRHDLYEVEKQIDYTCGAVIETGVEVEAESEGFRLPGAGNVLGFLGDGKVNKIYMTDFVLCGDNEQAKRDVTEVWRKTSTKQSDGTVTEDNELVRVEIHRTEPIIVQPRIDELDPANCAPLRPGDSKKEIDKKIEEYMAKKEKALQTGKKVNCDYGFSVSGGIAPSSVADAKDISRSAVQLALMLDARPNATDQAVRQAEQTIEEGMFRAVLSQYPNGTPVMYATPEQPMSELDRLKARVSAIAPDVAGRFNEVTFKRAKDGRLEFVAKGAGGEKATVRFGDDTKVTEAEVASLNELVYQAMPVKTAATK